MSEQNWTPEPWKYEEIDPHDPEWGACEIWPDYDQDPLLGAIATMILGVEDAQRIVACVNACQGAPAPIKPRAVAAMADVLETFAHEGRLQTYEDREQFRAWAAGALRLYHGDE